MYRCTKIQEPVTNFVDTSEKDLVLTTSKGSLFHVKETVATPISIDWTNYFDDAVTTKPNLKRCLNFNTLLTTGRFKATKPGFWQSMEETMGIIWVSGCAGTVARVIITPQEVSAESFQIGGTSSDRVLLFEKEIQRALTTLNMQCSDELIVGTQGDRQLTDHRGTIWHLKETNEGPFNTTHLFNAYEMRDAPEAQILRLEVGLPVALLGPFEHFRAVYNASNRRQTLVSDLSDNRGFFLNENALSAAQIDSDLLVLGLPNGRLLIGRPEQ